MRVRAVVGGYMRLQAVKMMSTVISVKGGRLLKAVVGGDRQLQMVGSYDDERAHLSEGQEGWPRRLHAVTCGYGRYMQLKSVTCGYIRLHAGL